MTRWDDATYRRNAATVRATATHCALCGRPLTGHRYPHPLSTVVDHRVSRAAGRRLGWSAEEINALDNLQGAHKECNERKQAGERKPPPISRWI